MFIQRVFSQQDLTRLDAPIGQDPFVTLIGTDASGLPIASQVPVLYRRDETGIVIEGHWAKANPQATLGNRPALIIVNGPHAYVSASWYPDKIQQARVPTWNYCTAHLHGTLEQFDDEAALIDLLERTSAHFEQQVGGGWRFDASNPAERRQIAGIIGFRLRPTRVELKDKLSQNHPIDNRRAVAAHLAASNNADAQQIACLMQASLKETPNAT